MRVLVVEDQPEMNALLVKQLNDAHYSVDGCLNGNDALDYLAGGAYDAVVLDVMLPGVDGLEVLRRRRAAGDKTPVLLLTARDGVEDRVRGLRLGAEDYLPKPFALSELLARVETVLRRCGKGERILTLAPDIEVDPAARVVRKQGQPVALTAKEFDLLLLFMQNKNIALSRDRIFERVWNEEYLGDSRTVDLHIQRMRKKLGLEDRLTAVYKVGYRLEG